MRRLDRLVLGELVGPWIFGVGIFTVLIMAGTYLFKITDYIVQGISPALLVELTIMLLPAIMVKTFAMAVLLAALLAFGRLSSDSEVVALRAAGASIGRIMVPVGVFGLLVAMIAFFLNEKVVPNASLRATTISVDIAKKLNSTSWRPVFTTINDPATGKIGAMLAAGDFNFRDQTLQSVWVLTYTKDGLPSFMLFAPKLHYTNEKDWRIEGGSKLFSYDLQTVGEFKGDVWPSQISKIDKKPEDLLAGNLKDLDSFNMAKMRRLIDEAKKTPQSVSRSQVANLEYGYYNKIALPLAAFIFGLVGAPLGIRNHRTGAAAGFWMSIIIIFGYMMLANLMAVYAQGGGIPSYVASFSPIAIGLIVAAVLIHRRNI